MPADRVATGAALDRLHVLAPTWLEYIAVRSVVRGVPVGLSGIALQRAVPLAESSAVVMCGLAGSLVASVPSGSVVVPERVGLADGQTLACDPTLVSLLTRGARRLGFAPVCGTLLTAAGLVTGAERARWAAEGFLAVDMETGLLAARAARFATVRVILDSPVHPIASEWLTPGQAVRRPRLWSELGWLAWAAPAYAWRAARVLRAALALAEAGRS